MHTLRTQADSNGSVLAIWRDRCDFVNGGRHGAREMNRRQKKNTKQKKLFYIYSFSSVNVTGNIYSNVMYSEEAKRKAERVVLALGWEADGRMRESSKCESFWNFTERLFLLACVRKSGVLCVCTYDRWNIILCALTKLLTLQVVRSANKTETAREKKNIHNATSNFEFMCVNSIHVSSIVV